MEAAPVDLLIRSPSQKQQDQLVQADRGWTVRRLKGHLRGVLSGAPLEEDQRLIYSGKLLGDDLLLDHVLPKHEPRHTLHLVCNSKNGSTLRQGKPTETNAQPTPSTAQQPSAVPASHGLRQRGLPQHAAPHSSTLPTAEQATRGAAPGSPYAAYSPQHILWFQQLYARQYYMQYLAAAAVSSPSQRAQEIPVVPAAAPPPVPLPNAFPVDNQPVNPNIQPRVVPGANQNMRMNAQGGLADEEEDVNRDWLDWIYTAARFFVFVSILYFYSSLSRFMIVMGAMILMCLHHAGIFPFRQRPAQPVPNNPPPQVAQDQNNNLQQEQPAEAHEAEASPDDGAATDLHNPRFVSTAWVFFKTFFASLIPEGPPGVVN
ncbi:homocysteine-responsive endoplasmic reticulum-resident ubiquitin-like domain member 1 protein [Ambystoma mexicanum]|uniref:homocysteine-responsive endoplasmic reticulum-resident ubiquitin-like domain member 1 protein n=1 Tax=Ambystoma mexicanum TaxID=8296 RepID=UPI0037E77C43